LICSSILVKIGLLVKVSFKKVFNYFINLSEVCRSSKRVKAEIIKNINMEHLKKELTKVILMSLFVIVVMIILVVWNNNTGVLNDLATKLF